MMGGEGFRGSFCGVMVLVSIFREELARGPWMRIGGYWGGGGSRLSGRMPFHS